MILEVPCQAAAEPSVLKTVTGLAQIRLGFLWRHSEKIHFVKRGDDGRPVPTKFAVKVHRMVLLISQNGQYVIDMLFGW